jgi:hypothetical protein
MTTARRQKKTINSLQNWFKYIMQTNTKSSNRATTFTNFVQVKIPLRILIFYHLVREG